MNVSEGTGLFAAKAKSEKMKNEKEKRRNVTQRKQMGVLDDFVATSNPNQTRKQEQVSCPAEQVSTLYAVGLSSASHSASLLHLSNAGSLARRVCSDVGGGFQNSMFNDDDWREME